MWALIACNRGANTDFTYLLRPLRDQLDRVSEFVDTVSTHLQSNADHMTAWNKVKNEWKGCPTKTLINGEYCDDIYTSVLTNRVALLSTGDEESEEVRELFACIEHLIRQLQTTYRETSSSFSEVSPWNSHEARLEFLSKEIISNEEVKAVNSVLCCMKDLLEALKSISASMTRLRAYRDIRLTQSGVRAVKTKKL